MPGVRGRRKRAHEAGDPVAQVDGELREAGQEDEAAGGRGQEEGRGDHRPQGEGEDHLFVI